MKVRRLFREPKCGTSPQVTRDQRPRALKERDKRTIGLHQRCICRYRAISCNSVIGGDCVFFLSPFDYHLFIDMSLLQSSDHSGILTWGDVRIMFAKKRSEPWCISLPQAIKFRNVAASYLRTGGKLVIRIQVKFKSLVFRTDPSHIFALKTTCLLWVNSWQHP